MPTLNVKKNLLIKQLGLDYSDDDFDELFFQFGLELDEISISDGNQPGDTIYKIDIPANRYDLLCLEGLVLALKIFTNKMNPPQFTIKPSNFEFSVDHHAEEVRPVLVGAIVRNLTFNQDIYNSFIELQDKIHQNLGRKRSIVSIGTHDLDTLKGPFRYTAIKPDELRFIALNQKSEYSASQLMELYSDSHLKEFLPIIRDKPRYPVILDSNDTVLSMPPIINGDHSKITLDTKNVLIEITATDREKATIALDSVVTMLMAVKGDYEAESLKVTHTSSNLEYITPDMSYKKEVVESDYINRSLGVCLSPEKIANLMTRMSLKAKVIGKLCPKNDIEVLIPPTRHDIINSCDIMEDVGIAFGYDNIEFTLPKCSTIATQVPLNKLSDQLRHELARCGYTEVFTFSLCSEAELSKLLRRPSCGHPVRLQNPKTVEFQVARTNLLSGLLKTLNSNKKMPLPLQLFEVSDIVVADQSTDVGARNERRLAAIYSGKQCSGFELIHGLLDRVMQVLNIAYVGELPESQRYEANGYFIERDTSDPAFLHGRHAAIIYNGQKIGTMGTLHPEVLQNFELNHPTSALELCIEDFPFLK